jgi:ribosomal protein S14
MDHGNIKLFKDEIKRIKFLKNEFNLKILKSILRNGQCQNKYRFDALRRIQKKNVHISKQRNFCLMTGRGAGVYKFANLSRQMINKMCQQGELNSIRTNNKK